MSRELGGVHGAVKDARHFGEIGSTSQAFGGASGEGERPKSLPGDPTVTKAADRTSSILLEACAAQKKFGQAVISIETVSERGRLLNAMVLKPNSVYDLFGVEQGRKRPSRFRSRGGGD